MSLWRLYPLQEVVGICVTLHSDRRVSLSMATPSSSPTPHHVTWIDTDGRKEDWFWSLTVSEDTLLALLSSHHCRHVIFRLWLPSTKLLIYKKNLAIRIVLDTVYRSFEIYQKQRRVLNAISHEMNVLFPDFRVIISFTISWSEPYTAGNKIDLITFTTMVKTRLIV